MKILFVCSGNASKDDPQGIVSFIRSQGESLRANGVQLEFFPIKGRGVKSYYRHIFILRDYLKTHSFDLLHAHYGLCGWVARLGGKGLPLVVSFMGDDLYGDADQRGRKKFSDYFYIAANKLLQYYVDFVIVKARNMTAHVIKRIKKKNRLAVIANGVDFERFKPMERAEVSRRLGLEENGKKRILFLGDPANPRKNFPLLQQAFRQLEGEGMAIQLIAPYPVPAEQVPMYLNAVDVFVLTSFKEGSPNVVKEAMACNCPVVSTDVGDTREVLEKTQGCHIVEYQAEDLAEKIKAVLKTNQKTTGREDIKHLEINQVAQNLIQIYQSLGQHAAAPSCTARE